MNYIEFAQAIKEKYPEYNDMSDLELAKKMVAAYPEYSDVTFEEVKETPQEPEQEEVQTEPQRKGIDLTLSGLLRKGTAAATTFAKMLYDTGFGRNNPDKIESPEAAMDYYNSLLEGAKQFDEEHPISTGIAKFGTDLAGYSLLPFAQGGGAANFIKNALVQGGITGGLEGLKNGDAIGGAKTGTTIAALLNSLPFAARIAAKPVKWAGKKIIQALTSLKPETLENMVQANSKALDLTAPEAERLAQDTTERLRDSYNALKKQKGQAVADEVNKLNDIEENIPIESLKQDIADVYNNYNYGRLNTARNLEGGTENYLNNLLDEVGEELSPIELLGLKRQIGEMTNWDIADAKTKNKILEQIYGKFNSRINKLSPSIEAANKDYASLYDLLGERSRLRTILNPKTDLETATSKLKNYKEVNDNIKTLENRLINEAGAEPFLKNIDDVNAALDLARDIPTGRNFLGSTSFAKEVAKIGGKLARKYNQSNLPAAKETIVDIINKIKTLLAIKATQPLLYGRVSNTTDD